MSVDMWQRLALRDQFRDVLCTAATQRGQRDEWVTGPDGDRELAWMAYERHTMRDAVNAELASRGLPPVTTDRIWRIERTAVGHCDYADKFALRCVFLVEDAEREAPGHGSG